MGRLACFLFVWQKRYEYILFFLLLFSIAIVLSSFLMIIHGAGIIHTNTTKPLIRFCNPTCIIPRDRFSKMCTYCQRSQTLYEGSKRTKDGYKRGHRFNTIPSTSNAIKPTDERNLPTIMNDTTNLRNKHPKLKE